MAEKITKKQASKILILLGFLPFLYTLLLALYNALDAAELTGFSYAFARIDSYIYAHSFGVVFFSLLTGIQLGLAIERNLSRSYFIGNVLVFTLAWASFLSYANKYGLLALAIAYVADLMLAYIAQKEQQIPHWYGSFRFKINGLIIVALLSLVLING